MRLVVFISALTVAAVLVVVLWPATPDSPTADSREYHTEPVPAEPVIQIVPVGDIEPYELETVSEGIRIAFRVRTRTGGPMALPEPALNEARGQYNADWILRIADALKSEGAFRTVLVTSADLYSGDLPYVLSLLSPDGKMMVLSSARLGGTGRVEFPLDQVRDRIRRLALRAFAASIGSRGCSNDCVLSGSLYLENLDGTPDYFCPECARFLQDRLDTGISSPHAHFQAALLYLEDGSLDGAIAELKKAIELKNDYLAAYLNLGELYLQKGWHAEAVSVLRRAAAIAPRNVEPRLILAQVFLLNNQPSRALEELQGALALDPDSPGVHRLLGITYQFYYDDGERARAHYRMYIKLGGSARDIRNLLETLQGDEELEEEK